MSTPLDRALKRLAELQREIDEVAEFIELYQRFEGKVVDNSVQMTLFKSAPELIGNETAGRSNQSVENSARKAQRTAHRAPRQGKSPK